MTAPLCYEPSLGVSLHGTTEPEKHGLGTDGNSFRFWIIAHHDRLYTSVKLFIHLRLFHL
jgi:hypothetical protein